MRFILLPLLAVCASAVFAAEDALPDAWKAMEPCSGTTPEYEVSVNGRKIDLYAVRIAFGPERQGPLEAPDLGGVYWVANFPCGSKTEISVKSTLPLDTARLLPVGKAPRLESRGDREVRFTADRPFKLVLERNGRIKPLVLFGNRPDDLPPKDAPGVVRFGPGIHRPGLIKLESNQTLAVETGAIVCGAVRAEGTNITVCGHGIITGCIYPRYRGPIGFNVLFDKCRNSRIRDVIITDSYSWNLCLRDSDGIEVEDVRICGSRTLCDDGFDVWNTSNVKMRNCFIRAQDDNVAVKGRTDDLPGAPCENILVEQCVFWCDGANVVRLGFESDAAIMRNIVVRDCDVLHCGYRCPPAKEFWSHAVVWFQASGGMPIADCLFEDIRIEADGHDMYLAIAHPRRTWRTSPKYQRKPGAPDWNYYDSSGSVSNCVLRNVSISGKRASYPVFIEGQSEHENVHGLKFENVTVFGEPLTEKSPGIHVGKFATGIEFTTTATLHNRSDYTPGVYPDVRSRAANTLKYARVPVRMFEKIRDGRMALGGYVSLASPYVCEAAGMCGLDFVWIDMEHHALTEKDILNLQIALEGTGCASVVRARSSDSNHLKPLLDIGIDAVIVPQVSGYDEAVRVVEACRYPQAGGKRGICVARQSGHGKTNLWDYIKRSETWPMIIIELEDDAGLSDLDRILTLKEVDAVMVGPSDLACSRSGLKEAFSSASAARLDDVANRINAAGKLFFSLGSIEDARRRKAALHCGPGDVDSITSAWRKFMREGGSGR